MHPVLRRIVLALGATLLAAGWGLMQYAGAQQRAIADGGNEAISFWAGEPIKVSAWLKEDHISGRALSIWGIIGMAGGAAITIVTIAGGRRSDPGM